MEGHGSSTLTLLAYLYTNFFFLIPHTEFFRGSLKVKISLLSMASASLRSLLAASISLREGREAGGLVSMGIGFGGGLVAGRSAT